MYQRMFGCLLGMQLVCFLPAYAGGIFVNNGRPSDGPPENSSQQGPITGTITDNNGRPLPNASVLVKGSKKGVTTDCGGNFSINAKTGDVLVKMAGWVDGWTASKPEEHMQAILETEFGGMLGQPLIQPLKHACGAVFGRYELSLPAGDYRLYATAKDRSQTAPVLETVVVIAGQRHRGEVRKDPGADR